MKFFKSVVTVGGLTGLSRVLGLVRDILIAAIFGAGSVADVFFVAFKIPNFFRRLLAEGSMAAAFVPLFSKLNADHGYDKAIEETRDIFRVLVWVLVLLVLVVEIATPGVVRIVAPGFYDHVEKFELATDLTRVIFPYILFISLGAFYGSILNSLGKFAAAAANPVILNLMMISGLGLCLVTTLDYSWVLAFSVLGAGVLQMTFMYVSLRSTGATLSLGAPKMTKTVQKWLWAMGPGALGAGAMQVNILVDTIIASGLPDGAVSCLFFADRLTQLPLGLLGIGISTVLLPHLSKEISQNNHIEAKTIQNRTFEYAMALTLPAAAALMIMGSDMICVLFERLEFTRSDVLNTGHALTAFAFGLPAYVLVKIFATCSFAYRDTKTPLFVSLLAILINIILNLVLSKPFGHVGIALATSIAAWINAGLLGYLLYKKGYFQMDARLKNRFPLLLLASFVMVVGIFWAQAFLSPLDMTGFLPRTISLGVLIGLGMGLYFSAAVLFQALDPKEILFNIWPQKSEI